MIKRLSNINKYLLGINTQHSQNTSTSKRTLAHQQGQQNTAFFNNIKFFNVSERMLEKLNKDYKFINNLLAEAHFHLNGYLNKQ